MKEQSETGAIERDNPLPFREFINCELRQAKFEDEWGFHVRGAPV